MPFATLYLHPLPIARVHGGVCVSGYYINYIHTDCICCLSEHTAAWHQQKTVVHLCLPATECLCSKVWNMNMQFRDEKIY